MLQNLEKKCHFNLGMPKWFFFFQTECVSELARMFSYRNRQFFTFFPIFSPPPEPPLIRNNFITIAHEGKDSIF